MGKEIRLNKKLIPSLIKHLYHITDFSVRLVVSLLQRGIYTSNLRSIILILVMVADFDICFFFYYTLTFLLYFRDVSSSPFVPFYYYSF